MFTPFPAPQRTSSPSTPLDHQFLTAPSVLLLLTPAAARIAGPSLLPCVIIIVHGVPRPRNAELRVPGQKTSSPAGGCSYPSCRASYFISFSLFTRFTEFMEIPHRFWCFSISVSCSTLFFYLVRSQVAYSGRFLSHLPLVLLGLRSVPKEDTGFPSLKRSTAQLLTIPGEFLDGPELPSSQFLSKIWKVISGFSAPPPHHVPQQPPAEVPAALSTAKFVFLREDASKPSLAPLYHGPYLVLERRSKFFRLQIGQKVDSVSVDRLKPVFSDSPVVPANPPPQGRPPLRPARHPPEPSSAVNSSSSKKKSVTFLNLPTVMLRRNPYRQARGRSTCSALTPPFLLGGSYVAEDDLSLSRIQRRDKKSFNSATSP